MAEIAVVPFVMGNAVLTFTTDSYSAHVSSAVFTPQDNAPVTWKGLTPTAVFSSGINAVWTLDLEFAQDWATTNSLSKRLLSSEGVAQTVTLQPICGGATITATVILAPGAMGGTVDEYATATVSLGVRGKPVLS
jgi:hypothetical protein